MSASVRAYIGLGSNLENPIQQVKTALTNLENLAETQLIAQSRLYASPPMGPPDQPDYINAVAAIDTSLSPELLLDELQRIERRQGRVREGERWGPRTVDLDLLLYGCELIESKRLTVPHAGIHERAFVLYPLREIAADDLVIPERGSLGELISACPRDGLQRLDEAL